jgi:hypothetical protein
MQIIALSHSAHLAMKIWESQQKWRGVIVISLYPIEYIELQQWYDIIHVDRNSWFARKRLVF